MMRLGDKEQEKEWSPKRNEVILYLLSVAAVIAILYF